MRDFLCLLAIGISGAAFFIAFRAENSLRALRDRLDALENRADETEERLGNAALDKLSERQRREEQFMNALQNIFDYGGDFQRLNAEEILRDR